MKRKLMMYVLSAIYGVAMASAGVNYKQPAFWIGGVYGVLMALNEFRSKK